jgi:hypothetical protein
LRVVHRPYFWFCMLAHFTLWWFFGVILPFIVK